MKLFLSLRSVVLAALLASGLALTGCDKLVATSNSAAAVTKRAFHDTKGSWVDLFTYHPAQPDSLPQTRYCYQMQSDIVCYDSEQRGMTARLVGYQDGENISWVQPGGGSLGASGGGPVALRSSGQQAEFSQSASIDSVSEIDTGPVASSNTTYTSSSAGTVWRYDKATDKYRKIGTVPAGDPINVGDLPKP